MTFFSFWNTFFFLILLQWGYLGLSDLVADILKQQNKSKENKQTKENPQEKKKKKVKKHPALSKCVTTNIIQQGMNQLFDWINTFSSINYALYLFKMFNCLLSVTLLLNSWASYFLFLENYRIMYFFPVTLIHIQNFRFSLI